MNIIISEGLYDKEFVENWTYGFEELKARAAEYPVEKVSESPGSRKRNYSGGSYVAMDTPGCIQVGSSVERQANCGQTMRAITCLMAVCGNIERPGSMISWVLPRQG